MDGSGGNADQDPVASEPDRAEALLLRAIRERMYESLPFGAPPTVLTTVILWQQGSHTGLLAWCIITLYGLIAARHLIRQVDPSDTRAVRSTLSIVNVATGTATGSLALLAGPTEVDWQLFVGVLLIVLMARNIADTAADNRVFLSAHVPISLGALCAFAITDSGAARGLLPITVLLAGYFFVLARSIRSGMVEQTETNLRNGVLVDELQETNERLDRLAGEDPLTGLANRRRFDRFVQQALDTAPRSVAMVCIDLDRFKDVNDSLGHDVGDQLLISVGRRLAEQCPAEGLVARLGGDELAICISGVDEPALLRELVERFERVFERPFVLDDTSVSIGASIGSALSVDSQGSVRSAGDLLRVADAQLYTTKFSRPPRPRESVGVG